MSDALPPPPGIGTADWAGTPQAVRILVLALQQQVVTLSERVGAVEGRTRRSSRNSSQPPSSDPPDAPAPPRGKRSGRKQGGQTGHEGRGRPLLPPAHKLQRWQLSIARSDRSRTPGPMVRATGGMSRKAR